MIKPLADYCDYVLLTYTYHWLPCTNDIYQWLTCTRTNDLHVHVPMTYKYHWLAFTNDMYHWLTFTLTYIYNSLARNIVYMNQWITCTNELHVLMTYMY